MGSPGDSFFIVNHCRFGRIAEMLPLSISTDGCRGGLRPPIHLPEQPAIVFDRSISLLWRFPVERTGEYSGPTFPGRLRAAPVLPHPANPLQSTSRRFNDESLLDKTSNARGSQSSGLHRLTSTGFQTLDELRIRLVSYEIQSRISWRFALLRRETTAEG